MKCSIQVAPLPHRLTWSVCVAEWAPHARYPCYHGNNELNLCCCCGCPQGAWQLGSQREDQDLSVAWDLMDSWKGGIGSPPLRAWALGPQRED